MEPRFHLPKAANNSRYVQAACNNTSFASQATHSPFSDAILTRHKPPRRHSPFWRIPLASTARDIRFCKWISTLSSIWRHIRRTAPSYCVGFLSHGHPASAPNAR